MYIYVIWQNCVIPKGTIICEYLGEIRWVVNVFYICECMCLFVCMYMNIYIYIESFYRQICMALIYGRYAHTSKIETGPVAPMIFIFVCMHSSLSCLCTHNFISWFFAEFCSVIQFCLCARNFVCAYAHAQFCLIILCTHTLTHTHMHVNASCHCARILGCA